MIRRAIADDEPAVRNCAEQAYARYIALIGRKPAPMTSDYCGQIAAGHIRVWADAGDSVCGFIVFYPQDGCMFLENVAVFPRKAGQGIGKALIACCEAAGLLQGMKSVRLYTNEVMQENIILYGKRGYHEAGRRREDGFNRVYFEKHLS